MSVAGATPKTRRGTESLKDNAFLNDVNTWLDVPGTSTIFGKPFEIKYHSRFSIQLKLNSAGTPNVSVSIQYTNEGPDDGIYWAVEETAVVNNLNNTDMHLYTPDLKPAVWARFKFVGGSLNPADVKVYTNVFMREH